MLDLLTANILKRQIIDFRCRCSTSIHRICRRNIRRKRCIIHGRLSLLLLGLHAPRPYIGVPSAVVFPRLHIDRDHIRLSFMQLRHIALLVEERHADLARKFARHLEDHILTLPFTACRRPPCYRHNLIYHTFELHIFQFFSVSLCCRSRKKCVLRSADTLLSILHPVRYEPLPPTFSEPVWQPWCCRREPAPHRVSHR